MRASRGLAVKDGGLGVGEFLVAAVVAAIVDEFLSGGEVVFPTARCAIRVLVPRFSSSNRPIHFARRHAFVALDGLKPSTAL